jgi:8-oxo-dGTP diphosphatase
MSNALPKTPALMTDCVVFDREGRVLLVRRKNEPFAGHYALPGGFVNIGETVEAACCREVEEETGIAVEQERLALVGVYSNPSRDPRGHTVSVAYTVKLQETQEPRAGSDALSAEWKSDWEEETLGFEHAQMLADAQNPGHWLK